VNAIAEGSTKLEHGVKDPITIDVGQLDNVRDDTAVKEELEEKVFWSLFHLLDNI
jgi:hypothetical protein